MVEDQGNLVLLILQPAVFLEGLKFSRGSSRQPFEYVDGFWIVGNKGNSLGSFKKDLFTTSRVSSSRWVCHSWRG